MIIVSKLFISSLNQKCIFKEKCYQVAGSISKFETKLLFRSKSQDSSAAYGYALNDSATFT